MPASSVTVHETVAFRPTVTGRLLGIWRLMERIHAGKWTELYSAQPADAAGSPRCDYVVKAMAPRLLSGEEPALQVQSLQQLRAQVLASQQARDTHLVPVLDHSLDGAIPYLVMPALAAKNLDYWMHHSPWQPLPVALWWIRQCAQGLSAMHAAGWIHGDLKPENMMIAQRGHVTLVDFGFAKPKGFALANTFQGTLAYAAPENILTDDRAGPVTAHPAADIYSLGIMLWQLTRHELDASRSRTEIAKLVECDGPVEQLILEMTATDPGNRPSAVEVKERLLRLEIESLGQHIRPTRRAA